MKALVLFSGGLDSLLAVKLIQEAGVEVEAVHFLQPFLPPEVEKKQVKQVKRLIAQTGARLHLVRLDEDYLRILESPKHRSEEHTSELQSRPHLVCRLLLEKKKIYLKHHLQEYIAIRRVRPPLIRRCHLTSSHIRTDT